MGTRDNRLVAVKDVCPSNWPLVPLYKSLGETKGNCVPCYETEEEMGDLLHKRYNGSYNQSKWTGLNIKDDRGEFRCQVCALVHGMTSKGYLPWLKKSFLEYGPDARPLLEAGTSRLHQVSSASGLGGAVGSNSVLHDPRFHGDALVATLNQKVASDETYSYFWGVVCDFMRRRGVDEKIIEAYSRRLGTEARQGVIDEFREQTKEALAKILSSALPSEKGDIAGFANDIVLDQVGCYICGVLVEFADFLKKQGFWEDFGNLLRGMYPRMCSIDLENSNALCHSAPIRWRPATEGAFQDYVGELKTLFRTMPPGTHASVLCTRAGSSNLGHFVAVSCELDHNSGKRYFEFFDSLGARKTGLSLDELVQCFRGYVYYGCDILIYDTMLAIDMDAVLSRLVIDMKMEREGCTLEELYSKSLPLAVASPSKPAEEPVKGNDTALPLAVASPSKPAEEPVKGNDTVDESRQAEDEEEEKRPQMAGDKIFPFLESEGFGLFLKVLLIVVTCGIFGIYLLADKFIKSRDESKELHGKEQDEVSDLPSAQVDSPQTDLQKDKAPATVPQSGALAIEQGLSPKPPVTVPQSGAPAIEQGLSPKLKNARQSRGVGDNSRAVSGG